MFSFFIKKKSDPVSSLKKILGDYNLPSFSGTTMQILQALRNPDSSSSDVAEVLSLDPGLTVKVLKIANSAAFSPVKKIENIFQAVALVGMSQLESLVLSAAVSSSMPSDVSGSYDMKKFWEISIIRGVLARELAKIVNSQRQSEAFIAGFLQDMAIPFLVESQGAAYLSIHDKWENGEGELHILEREQFGWDHAEVGTWICSQWDFPENIASAIGAHHGNEKNIYQNHPAVSLTAGLQEKLLDQSKDILVKQAFELYNISEDRTLKILENSIKNGKDLAGLMF
ncbi:MAG: HDOD domain-containing protein [Deltaproteobacteria bacterium]|nr:HDOD domain-containing protein [Deltaproteobacteria bacterium]